MWPAHEVSASQDTKPDIGASSSPRRVDHFNGDLGTAYARMGIVTLTLVVEVQVTVNTWDFSERGLGGQPAE